MDTFETANTAPLPFFASAKRPRDLARDLGLSEAELLDRHDGPEVVRLRAEIPAIVEALPNLGEVLSLTRNEAAVHEIVGTFGAIHLNGLMGLVLNPPLDLRLILKHWVSVFAVDIPNETGARRSIQVFDAAGDAVIKVHLRSASDAAAFEAIRARFTDEAAVPFAVSPYPVEAPLECGDLDAFRDEFGAMRDVHEFAPMLRRHGLDRRGSLEALGEAHVRRLAPDAAAALLHAASASGTPIMCFVGNRGCIQIFTGRVTNIKAMGPWINVLDPGFDLHLRQDLVAEAFEVRKPTKDGLLTSIEVYDAKREMIVQFFGERERDRPESAAWRELVAAIPDWRDADDEFQPELDGERA
ncbi:hemin-degrading factor [Aureimonas phyllosphaerae]|uniref:Putative hemin transport protein n=1 Tax=Aureimonas phyllosphaerae TaxID=1166078 RepID=A0A7W6FWD9_9HYPH|nr:ChuX/HutX family heme-like substrate-binding protein [Aureimonas phyllosphaerae]MBB3938118.1 putative hemin transport protein [Aureimonas phyllosphaerae]SFF56189.1 putative hemin transport protein [Aureimonas phyllosphaerae]